MKNFIAILYVCLLTSCNIGAGTLGGFGIWQFPVTQKSIDRELKNIYKTHPEYLVPDKWKDLDNWAERGYGFLDGSIFYFKNDPEEMYYVSFIDAGVYAENPPDARIAIRAVNSGESRWKLKDDFSQIEIDRIQKRFYQEIISKLEKRSNSVAKKEK